MNSVKCDDVSWSRFVADFDLLFVLCFVVVNLTTLGEVIGEMMIRPLQ